MKIVFTGGGTGGHIFPLIAVVREIKILYLQTRLEGNLNVFAEAKKNENPKESLNLYYVGPRDEFSLILLSQEGVRAREISAGKIRRYFNWKSLLENIVDVLFKMPFGALQSFFYLFFIAPDLIFSKGGYGSFPVVIAAWVLRIPVFLHESDADAGLSNLLLSKFAKKILVSFPKTERLAPAKVILVGNPIRKEVLQGTLNGAREAFKLTGEKPVIMILGGSQGAQPINDMILAILPNLLESYEILHQIGEKNFAKYLPEVNVTIPKGLEKYYHPIAFFREQELKHALIASDLIIARAGSGTLFEIAAVGKPSIIIPLPDSAQGHQLKNAYAYAASGSAIILEEGNTTPNFFLEKLKYLFSHPNDLEKMKQAALDFARPEAGKTIAKIIFDSLKV